jgi:undecaprenyl-diphosphatase
VSLEKISGSRLLAPLSPLFTGATYLGDGYLWGGLALLLMLRGEADRRYVLIGVGVTIINVITYTLLKLCFKRPRPVPFQSSLRSLVLERYSFPSGHSSISFSIAFLVAYFYPLLWGQLAVYLTAAFVGLSRIYVREHYLSDVIAGALWGTALTAALLPAFSKFTL